MVGADGLAFTVTAIGADVDSQPFPFITVTVQLPEVVTLIELLVELFDHVFPDPADDVRSTLPPAQNVVAPLGVIVGTAGLVLTVTTTGADDVEHPLTFVNVTE